ncbi:MAG: O-antigen ligase family protein [Actinomycetota bacterium]|nr:O-antigen ligase family protein [Actinomycetota bacterium]
MLDSRRLAAGALLLLPAGLMAFFAFDAGGYYPGPPAYVAVVLCVVMVVRVTMADNPLEGMSRALAIGCVAMAGFALVTLLSAAWSHAPGLALVKFDLALVYLLAMVLFGSVARTPSRLRWMLRGLALGIVVICGCSLATRLLPDVFPTTYQLADNRLSFPLTYWNSLGLLAALGILLCVHISSDPISHKVERVLAAAAVPVLVSTLFFTFSRGAIAAVLITLVIYLLVARPRLLLSFLLASVLPTAIALKVAYDASLLASLLPTGPAAAAQGHHVAVVLLACVVASALIRLALWVLDRRLVAFHLPSHARARVSRVVWGSLVVVVLIASVALSGTIARQYQRFLRPAPAGSTTDLRTRLTDPANDGRIELWREAWHQFTASPLLGRGAGTFANTWAIKRSSSQQVQNVHNLYLEVLDELGLVGFALLAVAVLAILIGPAARARGPDRPLYAAIFAVLLAMALHNTIDWDWQMPAVTVIFFALGGAALARGAPAAEKVRPFNTRARVPVGLGCVLLAVTPAYVWLGQRKLNQAAVAFSQGNCQAAVSAASSSISILGVRAEPYEVLGFCDIRQNRPQLAIAAIRKAITLDANNWVYTYDLALFRAVAGLNPKAAARHALALDPRDVLAQDAWRTFRSETPNQWTAEGRRLANAVTSL